MENIYLVLLSGLFAMLFSFWKTSWINKQDQGTDRMEKIGKAIADGASYIVMGRSIRNNLDYVINELNI